MSKTIRIAVASSDGRSVDQHFGWATQFYIYDVTGDDFTLVEVRPRHDTSCDGECEPGVDRAAHFLDSLRSTVELLKDCSILLVARIGEGPAAFLAGNGIRVFSVNIPVAAALQKLGKADR